ncbi:MAG TPA: type II secretion system F family protein [Acidimicrobiia bacterium]|nr:type II secretion system F family protein [Acidimicrobiia bacterium]
MSPLGAWLVGVVAGLLLATPIVRRARASVLAARARDLAPPRTVGPAPRRTLVAAVIGRARFGVVGRVVRGTVARRRAARGRDRLSSQLPLVADLLTVAVGAGCTPYLAVEAASRWAPDPTAAHLTSVLTSCALGVGFGDALADLGRREPVLRPLAESMEMCERTGAPVAPVLARLADDARAATRRRAETRARTVPVRLLFPLVFLVLPAFGLLTVAPALLTGFARS